MRPALEVRASARARRAHLTRASRGRGTDSLPAWPFVAPFAGYLVGWALGLGELVWLLAALACLIAMAGMRGLHLPRLGLLWLFFLAWVGVSLIMVDSVGRLVGAGYRALLTLAAGVLGFYLFQARRALSLRVVLATMTAFLCCATIGGYLAMAAPLLVLKTPLAYVLPDSLLANELVQDMAVRRTTQWNPDSYVVADPRPAAPFLYANTWGNIYSFALPLALAHLRLEWVLRSRWRWVVALVCVASVVPAVSTLNRGMFIGLGVVAAWVALQYLRVGNWAPVLVGALAGVVGVAGWLLSPASDALQLRLEASSSTEDRFTLYTMTLAEVAKSPLLGYGAPRPSTDGWLPAMGTQGQLWTVVFSHGFVGLALFLGFFGWAFARAINRLDLLGAVLGGIMLATIVESFFYGLVTGQMLAVCVAALILRCDRIPDKAPDG